MKFKTVATGLVLVSASLSVAAADLMTGEQIKSVVSGNTVTWEHMFKSKSGKSYYSEDGTLTGVMNGSSRKGTWKVEGNQICVSWGNCREMESDGEGGYYKVKNGTKRVVRYTRVEDGNKL